MTASNDTLHAVLGCAIDYAGLFPPASLDLATVLANYAAYTAGEHAWALGRLILPASSLDAFEAARPRSAEPWPISVLLGPDFERDLQLAAHYDTFECKLPDPARIDLMVRALPAGARIFFEIDARTVTPHDLAAIQRAGASAKIRTGGLTPEAIPASSDIARFLEACARHRLSFKATAGLHHPVRSRRALTYAADSPVATMHGFMNLLVAASLAHQGATADRIGAALDEEDASAFRMNQQAQQDQQAQQGLCWRGHAFANESIAAVRRDFMLSFGSCSFTEPLADSRELGWLL